MTAFDASKNTAAMNFADADGRPVTVRPVYHYGIRRNVVELNVDGTTVHLPNGIIRKLLDGMTWAALLGEIENLAMDNPTPNGA
ncbi:hypothetical protein ACFVZH_08010 [Streptomyces sp. NPDC059534]|uniref:hypothetical protein n=1 Tax=Streptomyces sp. NPDC059534 TaxID=3346859 RepID=UPI0036A26954